MSGNGYNNNYAYYYSQPPPNYQTSSPGQVWPNWGVQPPSNNYYQRNPAQFNPNQVPPPYYNQQANKNFQQRRHPAVNGQPDQGPPQNWQQRNFYHKRQLSESSDFSDGRSKPNKKKKKPLSQNIPTKKDWTPEEAERALNIEKEQNKRHKHHSLIIKFPDLELNRDIVSKFHPAIENVHFQQPSTPRFCFIALQESSDPDKVISELNKIKFGDGYLTAEYKRDREEDQNIGPEDIDPLTLYVGNLAQEITKDDMVKAYPKQRRIDIGYAKKMKYTRYAFVSFKNVNDSIEAFQKTHATQMHSKSLIVRFRRLHGTVGMPGEAKPQNQPKERNGASVDVGSSSKETETSTTPVTSETPSEIVPEKIPVNLQLVKPEPLSDDEFNGGFEDYPNSVQDAFALHKPFVKKEEYEEGNSESDNDEAEEFNCKPKLEYIKTETPEDDVDDTF